MEAQMDDGNGGTETSGDAGLSMYEVHINQEPCEGMSFESEKAARDFYDDYASRVGFITRVLSSRKSERDGSIISRGLGCRGDRTRDTVDKQDRRKACTAMVLLKKEKTDKWVIRKVVRDHNHPLVIHLQKDRRTLDEKDKKIQELTAELRAKKRMSSAYREQLLTFMKDVEDHGEHFSKKVQSVYEKLRKLEADMDKISQHQ